MLNNAVGGGGVNFPVKKSYKGVLFTFTLDLIRVILTYSTLLVFREGGWVANFQEKSITKALA